MPEPREFRSIIEAAEQAAAAGDYASAERSLREAVVLQEARLGPLHPDLANTLNNLGVVCEMNDHPVEAEDCFRRAFTIATTVLTPDHPFVATSRQNLREFCEARGKSVDLPGASSESRHAQVVRTIIRPLAIGGVGPAVMLIVILVAVRPWLSPAGQAQSRSAIVADSPPEAQARPQAPLSAAPITPPPQTNRTSEGADASTPAQLTVVRARLCADLEDFACDPPDRPIPAGPLFYYTEVKSTTATTIQHRWYRDNRLYQSVELRVKASPRTGDRAYSRSTMTRESAGNWRVELRTEDGVLLHEERFAVR